MLQEALAQRQVRAVQPPSVILGGNRCADEPANNYMYQPGYDSVGGKRKTSPKSVQKSGKKIKHSGGTSCFTGLFFLEGLSLPRLKIQSLEFPGLS